VKMVFIVKNLQIDTFASLAVKNALKWDYRAFDPIKTRNSLESHDFSQIFRVLDPEVSFPRQHPTETMFC
jgi:hypothetical protein